MIIECLERFALWPSVIALSAARGSAICPPVRMNPRGARAQDRTCKAATHHTKLAYRPRFVSSFLVTLDAFYPTFPACVPSTQKPKQYRVWFTEFSFMQTIVEHLGSNRSPVREPHRLLQDMDVNRLRAVIYRDIVSNASTQILIHQSTVTMNISEYGPIENTNSISIYIQGLNFRHCPVQICRRIILQYRRHMRKYMQLMNVIGIA